MDFFGPSASVLCAIRGMPELQIALLLLCCFWFFGGIRLILKAHYRRVKKEPKRLFGMPTFLFSSLNLFEWFWVMVVAVVTLGVGALAV